MCIGMEQLRAQGKILLFVAGRQTTRNAGCVESPVARMQQKAANELLGGDGHAPGSLTIGGAVIPVLEGNLLSVQGENRLIGNGNVVSVLDPIVERQPDRKSQPNTNQANCK